MNTKSKLIISLSSLCLVAAVVIFGVFAFATQSFSVGYNASFTAKNVSASVSVYLDNNGSVTQQGSTITFTDTESSKRTESINIGSAENPIAFNFNKENISVDPITIYVVVANNDSVNNLYVNFEDTSTSSDNVTVSRRYSTFTSAQTLTAGTPLLSNTTCNSSESNLQVAGSNIFYFQMIFSVTAIEKNASIGGSITFDLKAFSTAVQN